MGHIGYQSIERKTTSSLFEKLNLNDVPFDGEDQVDGGVGEETEEEEEIHLMSWPVHGSKKR